MGTLRSFALVPDSIHARAQLAGGVYGELACPAGGYLRATGYVGEGLPWGECAEFRSAVPDSSHTRSALSGGVYGEFAGTCGTYLNQYWGSDRPFAENGAQGDWVFGGQCEGSTPRRLHSEWAWAGVTIGLLDGRHVSRGTSDWEFGGQVEGYVTGCAVGSGTWEFGGTVTLPDGTEETCITGDGSASQAGLGGGSQPNYAF